MKISPHQETIMRAALASPDFRVPRSLARRAETYQALTFGGELAWMRYVEQGLRLELTRHGAASLGSAELAVFDARQPRAVQRSGDVMTCARLAEMLITYGDRPVEVNFIIALGVGNYIEQRSNNELHLELNASPNGAETVSVAVYHRAEARAS